MRKFLSLFAAVLFAASMMADSFAPKALADITADDVVVVTMDNGTGVYALANDKGTSSAPTAVAVTVTDGKISSDATNILWKVTKDGDNLSFIAGESNLYCTNTNNGVRVGSSTGTFIISNDYLCCTSTSSNRYLGVYNSQDWRCYTTINSNIQNQTLAFYVKETEQGGQGGDSGQTGESMTVYMLNNIGWNAVLAYVWTQENNNYDVYKTWPGDSAVKAAEQIYGMDVYSYTFPASYKNVIFNGGNNKPQTEDLTWSAAKPYFLPDPESSIFARTGTWYAREEIPSPTQPVDSMTIYMVNDLDWTTVNAYVWPATGTSYKAWPGEAMTKQAQQINGKDVYSYTFPASFVNVIFNNGNDGADDKTANLTWNAAKPYYYAGAWYELDSIPAAGGDDPQPVEVAYYLVGSMNNWTPAEAYKFGTDESCAEGEFILHATLAENDEIKVIKVQEGQQDVYYPEGMGNNYIVDAAHAGEKDIYFRPAGNADWSAFGGYFWMGENQVAPVADFTNPFTLKFNGNGTSDNSNTFKVEDGIAAIFDAASVPYVSALTTVANVYAGRTIADEPSSLKFGTSSKQGTLAFTLAQAIEVDSIVVNATQYGNNAAKISVNGTEFDVTAGNKKPQDCKFVPEGAIDAITIAQTGSERIYLRYITVYPKSGSGETPQPEDSVTLYFVNVPAWEAVYAYTWIEGGAQNAEWPGEAMTPVNTQINEKDVYAYRFPSSMNNIIFNNGNGGEGNQTENLTWNAAKPYFYNGVWYALEEIPTEGGGDPQPTTPKFYIIGGEDIVGEGKYDWNLENALPSYDREYVLNLAAGFHKFKVVTIDSQWKGIEALTDTAAGIYTDADGNICFDLAEAGAVTVVYDENEFTVSGNFAIVQHPQYYVVGDEDIVGPGHATWNKEGGLVSYGDTLELNLAAGVHLLKVVTPTDAWLGFEALTDTAAGLYPVDDLFGGWNIGFTLEEAAVVKVIYNGEIFKLIGDFYVYVPQFTDGYYLVGNKYNWTPAAERLFKANPETEGEFFLAEVTLEESDSIKVVKVVNDEITDWYPNGDNYVVDAAHAGVKTIYFRPAGNEDWSEFGGYFWMGENVVPQPETVTLYFINANGWENVYAYVWGATGYQDWPGEVAMLTDQTYNEMAIYSYTFPTSMNHIIFNNNDGIQTADLAVDAATPYFYVDTWYASLEEIPAVVVPAKFYVMMGEDAIKVTEDSYTIENLEANVEYSLKISLNGTWQTLMGYGFLTDIADGLHTNDAGDILFTLAEAGDVVVTYIAPATEGGEYTFTVTGNFVPYVEPTHTYTVAGEEAILGVSWTPAAVANDMILDQESGLYKLVKDSVVLNAGTYYYKVAIDHAWNHGEAAGNSELAIDADGLYTITFTYDPATATTGASAQLLEPIEVDPTAVLGIGDWNNQEDWSQSDLTLSSDKLSATITKTLAVGVYRFKMIINGGWRSNGYEFHRDFHYVEGIDGNADANMKLIVDKAGEYTFTWTFATNALDITFPEKPEVPMTEIRLVPGVWNVDGAKFAAVTWHVGEAFENGTVSAWFEYLNADTLIGNVPNDADSIAFARFNSAAEAPSMDMSMIWNHTDKLLIDKQTMIYTISGWPEEGRDFCPGYWGEYIEPVYVLENGYYLVGNFSGVDAWSVEDLSAEKKFAANPDNEAEYQLAVNMAENDQVKVAYVENDQIIYWYPKGDNYTVDHNHAGPTTMYFRPDYFDDWNAFGGYFYIVPTSTVDITNVDANVPAVKILRDGQILIIKGNKTFNAQGQLVK